MKQDMKQYSASAMFAQSAQSAAAAARPWPQARRAPQAGLPPPCIRPTPRCSPLLRRGQCARRRSWTCGARTRWFTCTAFHESLDRQDCTGLIANTLRRSKQTSAAFQPASVSRRREDQHAPRDGGASTRLLCVFRFGVLGKRRRKRQRSRRRARLVSSVGTTRSQAWQEPRTINS